MNAKIIDKYQIDIENIPVQVTIIKMERDPVAFYSISLLHISEATKIIIDKIKEEIINEVSFNLLSKTEAEDEEKIKKQFKEKVIGLMKEYFGNLDDESLNGLSNYVILTSLGLGDIEFLLKDSNLEEIVVNNSQENVWVYHRSHGWLKTDLIIDNENKIRHFATTIGRESGKGFSILEPLLDAHLKSGDRVNATLKPITTKGNTITIRKFAEKPWTITDFIRMKTIDYATAAFLWQAIQYELSMFIVGGTGSGKTSMLNVLANFLPPNQRVISIEDTRELQLPNTLHWIPMETRLPNPEGKGEVTMLDLMVNSLRMRPDRIIVGEIRRKREAEVLFEAIHTGHSVYATLHASDVNETIARLTNSPIDIPRALLSSLNLLVVQNRNRRTGLRRTFQIAEMLQDGNPRILRQLDVYKDVVEKINDSVSTTNVLRVHAGLSNEAAENDLEEKIAVLKWIASKGITDVHEIGLLMSDYYTDREYLMKKVEDG
ncbi:type II/IV secretion system ATPase subunit [Candidatus Woesearchaeota archaeon]|nr:type II/IV secretion system ATPase subunit [Candidatus Woesearchaeota archaeon]